MTRPNPAHRPHDASGRGPAALALVDGRVRAPHRTRRVRGTDRFQLIGGEIVLNSPLGRRNVIIAERLARRWTKLDVPGVHVASKCQFNLSDTTYVEPDVLVWSATIDVPDVRGPDAFLVVEVADTSLRKDRIYKRNLYAAHGVREYWVIDAETLSTRVHRGLANGDYADVVFVAAADMLTPMLAPALAVRLAELGL